MKVRVLKNDIEKSVIVSKIFTGGEINANSYNSGNQSILKNSFILRKELEGRSGEYSAKEGFVIHFDFMSYLPPNFNDVHLRYGIFKKG
jgi:hypothetical protein